MRNFPAALGAIALVALAGCAGGPPRYGAPPGAPVSHAPMPAPPRDERPLGGDALVRVGLHWEPGTVRLEAPGGLLLCTGPDSTRVAAVEIGTSRDEVTARVDGEVVQPGTTLLRVEAAGDARIAVQGRAFRGALEITARADSLFVVNVVPLEDYLRGVVPGEIGARVPEEREAVAAQAVAARTYTVKRFGQYGSLPFDVYASVQDQLYEGAAGEEALADEAIRETRGLVIADRDGLLEAYYSSTCGGYRADIATAWPWRPVHSALRGGPDGDPGAEWCRDSKHFSWEERWSGETLSALVRAQVPALLELPAGSVRGELRDVRITRHDASGRAEEIEYVTDAGSWTVPGDRNRWVLRRPDGSILRSTRITLDVRASGGRVEQVIATGGGNGHGVGMCQTGAKGRARAGASFREILQAYYPGTEVRPLRGSDLPPGRGAAS
ncbi:MAG: SpoIID/LytB domain-containing protein [bacterium]